MCTTQNTKLYSFSLYQVLHSFLLNYSRLQHTEFRESSSSLLTPGGMKSLLCISQGSLQVHRVGKRQQLIFVSAWHSPCCSASSLHSLQSCDGNHSQLEMFGTSKLCCQAGTPKMLSVLSCLHLFAKPTLSFQHRSVFPDTAWNEYFTRSVSMSNR